MRTRQKGLTAPEKDRLAKRFRRFGETGIAQTSPLYEQLCFGIADDAEILGIAIFTRKGQPVPNSLFAAVHYLLLQGAEHPLENYYPNITPRGLATDAPYPHFRDFCLQHRDAIVDLISSRFVQTNEANRCIALLPAFHNIAQRSKKPLAMIEVGTSAGLNLAFDRYRYQYGDQVIGDDSSLVELETELRGNRTPPIPDEFPEVSCRMGIDVRPIDVFQEDEVLWLRALVWPEHRDRMARLRQAIHIARMHPNEMVSGDVFDTLPEIAERVPKHTALVVFHSFVINQFTRRARQEFSDLLASLSNEREIYRVSLEWLRAADGPRLEMTQYRKGEGKTKLLARSDGHVRWLEWVDKR